LLMARFGRKRRASRSGGCREALFTAFLPYAALSNRG
jgi:hypothetical protein